MKDGKEIAATAVIIVLSIVVSLAIPVLIIAGGIWVYNSLSEDEVAPQTTTQTTSYQTFDDTEVEHKSDYIGQEYESLFVDGCVGAGASQSQCQCAFNYLDDNMTNTEFIEFTFTEEIESHPMFNKAIINCL